TAQLEVRHILAGGDTHSCDGWVESARGLGKHLRVQAREDVADRVVTDRVGDRREVAGEAGRLPADADDRTSNWCLGCVVGDRSAQVAPLGVGPGWHRE